MIEVSTAVACGSNLTNKVLHGINLKKNIANENYYETSEQTVISIDELLRQGLQVDFSDKKEYESICNNVTIYFKEKKNESFPQKQLKTKTNIR